MRAWKRLKELLEINKLALEAIENTSEEYEWIQVTDRLPDKAECNRFDIKKDPKLYRTFECIVVMPGYQKQIKRLYFSEDGHWYHGWEFFDPYVIKWLCVSIPCDNKQ